MSDSASEEVWPRVKWLHRHLWCVLAIWSGMFFANEAHRIYVTNQVLKHVNQGDAIFKPRYPALNKSPAILSKMAKALGGEHWNDDLVSILLERPSNTRPLFSNLAHLQRLGNLQVRGGNLPTDDIRRIATMKQLQFVYLLQDEVDEEETEQLRNALPHTFVCVFRAYSG